MSSDRSSHTSSPAPASVAPNNRGVLATPVRRTHVLPYTVALPARQHRVRGSWRRGMVTVGGLLVLGVVSAVAAVLVG